MFHKYSGKYSPKGRNSPKSIKIIPTLAVELNFLLGIFIQINELIEK
jgi:hypothetical protein